VENGEDWFGVPEWPSRKRKIELYDWKDRQAERRFVEKSAWRQ